MRSQLWLKLTGAYALIVFIGVIVTVWLTSRGAATQFQHLMVASRMVRPAVLQQVLADYYAQRNGWSSLEPEFGRLVIGASDGMMTGMFGNMMGMHENRIQVLDRAGQVVADSGGPAGGAALTAAPLDHWPIIFDEELVGELVVEGSLMGAAAADPASLVGSVTRSVLVAALIAAGAGLLLAAVLVRQITRPLADLTHASRQIAHGDLAVRVPVQSHDEVGELTDTFNQMAASLQEQETLRQHLMADLAHELRTPLTGLQGAVEAMQDGVFPTDAENLEALHEQVLLLTRLVEDLRTLANAEAGQLRLDLAPVDLADLCRRQVNAWQFQAAEGDVRLVLEHPPNLPLALGDSQRLNQVLLNLLDNAFRHSPVGSTVTVTAFVAGAGVGVTVTDRGPGVRAADLPHVFDRFYRGDSSHSRGAGGSGLGLAIARQLIEAHHGRIWVDSPPPGADRGAEFGFVLPRPETGP